MSVEERADAIRNRALTSAQFAPRAREIVRILGETEDLRGFPLNSFDRDGYFMPPLHGHETLVPRLRNTPAIVPHPWMHGPLRVLGTHSMRDAATGEEFGTITFGPFGELVLTTAEGDRLLQIEGLVGRGAWAPPMVADLRQHPDDIGALARMAHREIQEVDSVRSKLGTVTKPRYRGDKEAAEALEVYERLRAKRRKAGRKPPAVADVARVLRVHDDTARSRLQRAREIFAPSDEQMTREDELAALIADQARDARHDRVRSRRGGTSPPG